MGGTEAFPNLGKHCSHSSCGQLDFLPFKCDACSQVFCLDHRSYTAHECPKAGAKDSTVIVCPFCASGVKTVAGEDPNSTIERHLQTSCDPSNYDRVMKKPKCSVRGCKEVLTFSNKFHCKVCSKNTCMKHRFPADHACQAMSSSVAGRNGGGGGDLASRFLQALSIRTGSECGTSSSNSRSKSSSSKWPRIF
ncbi:zinc finger AN1 and C2H2 domain-containing stress-associated protein 16 [Selaginella moellendorffii]|nr:zinc finger AN1 and C2H2 domain-containing stress-associated protein 16 [Selaginella moellendorffii]|eukprot:XP_002972586.2 zinc finger AN1 and C2H2 domain-containing stress-associated protein 16 [Selaginella moellendorffii]